jgi:CRISPR-associated endonuclease/helicase Cas3
MDLKDLWAKSSPAHSEPSVTAGYPLLPHLLDVAAVAAALVTVVPCPVPLPCSMAWISALVGLHEFGKASPGFQRSPRTRGDGPRRTVPGQAPWPGVHVRTAQGAAETNESEWPSQG